MEMGEPRRGAGAAGAAVDRLLAIEDGVAAMGALTLGLVGPHDVIDAADAGLLGMDGLDLLAHH